MMDQSADPSSATSPDKTMDDQNLQKQEEPATPKLPNREENPRVKCKDCGAFGHTIRSRKCPMKSWDGATAPQPLDIRKEKENRDPRKPQNPQSPEPVNETEKEREERERREQQQKALLLKFPKKPPERKPQSWKDTTHSGDYLRRPSRPRFVHINRKLSLSPTEISLPSDEAFDEQPSTEDPTTILSLEEDQCQTLDVPSMSKTAFGYSDEDSTFSENPAEQSTNDCFYQSPQATFSVQEMDHLFNTQSPAQHSDEDKHYQLYPAIHTDNQNAELSFKATKGRSFQVRTQTIPKYPKKWQLGPYQIPQKSTEKPMLQAFCAVPCSSTSEVEPEESPQGTSIDPQPACNRAPLRFAQSRAESHPLPSPVPVQPLRMVFTRLRNGFWSSKILETSSSHLPENKLSPDKISPSLKQSEGPHPWVPVSSFLSNLPTSSFEESK